MNYLLLSGSGFDWDIVLDYISEIKDLFESFSNTTGDIVEILYLLKDIWKIITVAFGALLAVAGVAFVVTVIAVFVGFALICYVIPAIALSVMGKRAGYKYWWLPIIPILQNYVMFVLPRQNFKLLFINTRKRYIPAIVFF